MDANGVLAQSFLNSSVESTTSTAGKLAAGQPVTLTLTFPPPLSAAPLSTPLFSASATWGIYSDEAKTQPMIEGEDYLVLSEGGLSGQVLTLVFNPPLPGQATETVYVRATAVATAYNTPFPVVPVPTNISTGTQNYDTKFDILAVEQSVLDKLIQGLVDLLYIEVPQLIVNPGDVVAARIARRKAPSQPQLVTSLLHDAPSVEIRGSIPLDNILNFILEPFTKISAVIPSGNPLSKTGDVTASIKKLAPSALTVPVRLDIKGQKLTTAFAPIGDKMPISFSRTPDESGDLQGFLPLGQWPLSFSIPNVPPDPPNQAGIQWNIGYKDSSEKDLPYAQPTDTFGTLRNLLFLPQIQTLGLPPLPPGNATIEIKPYLKISDQVVSPSAAIKLQQILLEVTSMHLPEVFACFENVLTSSDPGTTQVTVSRETGYFAGSLDELLQLLGTLSVVLNDLISILSTVVTDAPNFTNLLYLNQAIKVMSGVLTRAASKRIKFVIADNNTFSLDKKVTSFVAIAPRPIKLWAEIIINSNGDVETAHLTVDPTSATGGPFYSSYIHSLNYAFNLANPLLTGTITADEEYWNYNDSLYKGEFNQK